VIILNPNRFVQLRTTKDMKTHNEIFRPSLEVIFLGFLSIILTGKFVILYISGVLCVAVMDLIAEYVSRLQIIVFEA
jgi:hypothetical protein